MYLIQRNAGVPFTENSKNRSESNLLKLITTINYMYNKWILLDKQ